MSAASRNVTSSAGGGVDVSGSLEALSSHGPGETESMLDLLIGAGAGEYNVNEFNPSGFQSYAPAPQSYDNVLPMFPWENAFAMPAPIKFTAQHIPQALSYPVQSQWMPWSNAGFSAPYDLMAAMSSSSYPPIAPMPYAAAGMHAVNTSTFVFPTLSPGPENTAPPMAPAPVTLPAAVDAPEGDPHSEAATTEGTDSMVLDAPLGAETLPNTTVAQGRPQRARCVPKNPDGTQPVLPGTRDSEPGTQADIATQASPKQKQGSTADATVLRKKGRL